MALITGKTLMDRNAPDAVRDDVASGTRDSESLIKKWHNRGRLRYAVTPRFAITSTEAQLQAAGDLYRSHPGILHADPSLRKRRRDGDGEIALPGRARLHRCL